MACIGCRSGSRLPPPLTRQAMTFGAALIKEGLAIMGGVEDMTPAGARERLSICQSCAHLEDHKTCILCGCPVHRKVGYRTAKCDEGKW